MLRDDINAAVKDAMKAKDERKLSTLRMVNSTIKNADIEARGQGKPPLADGEHQLHFSRADTEAATAFADQARALLLSESAASLPSKLAPAQFERVSRSLSWWFAGVAVLADWVGSDTQYFPYVDEPMPLADFERFLDGR